MLNTYKLQKFIPITLVVFMLLFASFAPASADEPQRGVFSDVNQPGEDPSLCDIIEVINNVKNIGIKYLGPVAVVMVMVSGIMFMVSGGSKELHEKARGALTYAIIGLLIILAAWAIITLIFKAVGYMPDSWWEVQCTTSSSPSS